MAQQSFRIDSDALAKINTMLTELYSPSPPGTRSSSHTFRIDSDALGKINSMLTALYSPSPGTQQSFRVDSDALAKINTMLTELYSSSPTLTATLVFADSSPTLVFNEASATTIGSWTNPNTGSVQTIKKLTNGSWTVYFRPEANGTRHEIIFEWGVLFGSNVSKGAYTCTINGWGAPVVISVPNHWWRSRWRWQSAKRPFTATASDLLAAKKIPPFGTSTISLTSYTYISPGYTPMADVGIHKSMPDTGERPDIGLCTEHIARACFSLLGLTGGSSNAITTMMDQAEAAGSIPWHFRDPTTGVPIDFNVHPTYSVHPNDVGQSYYMGDTDNGSGWSLNVPHSPCLSYIPFLLTGDLYHLEEMQFIHTYDMCASRFDAGGVGTARLSEGAGEERGLAWQLRNIAYATFCTPSSNSTGCLKDKTYLTTIMTNTHDTWYNAYVASIDPWQAVFGFIVPPIDEGSSGWGYFPWQSLYVLGVLLHVIDLGFSGWAASRDRVFNAHLNYANGTSGWDRQTYPYFLLSNQLPGQGTVITTWAQEGSYYQSTLSGSYPLTPNVYYQVIPGAVAPAGGDYIGYLRGALAWGARQKSVSVGDAVTYLTNVMTNWNVAGAATAKWSFY